MRRPWAVLAAAGVIGVAFDVLFWGKDPGISFPLFVALLAGTLLVLARVEGAPVSRGALVLLPPTLLLSLAPAVRAEPGTVAVNALLALALTGLMAHTLRSGAWMRYGVRDWLWAGWDLPAGTAVGAARAVAAATRLDPAQRQAVTRRGVPVARAAALTIPVLLVFGGLLASADPVFAARMDQALGWLLPRAVPDLWARIIVITLVAAVAAGMVAHALADRQRTLRRGAVPRALGFPEAVTVLGSVNLLFAVFVLTQAQTHLGGERYVAAAGLTFAEYARRGFFELVVVAVCSLLLLLGLASLTRRSEQRTRRVFSGLSAGLTVLVLVMLVSAFARLLLYEQAYGFTRARVSAHTLMVWLGVLLVATLALELSGRLRQFPTAAIAAAIGFALTLAVVNVDGIVASRNLARAAAGVGAELDRPYLQGLSTDAAPALAEHAGLPWVAEHLGCLAEAGADGSWQSATWSAWRAQHVVDSLGVSCPTPPR